MPSDLTIDTNVLAHSCNPQEPRFSDALSLVKRLLGGTELLCVDDGFDIQESRNLSVIGSEYRNFLPIGTIGFLLVSQLAQTQRVKRVSKKTPAPISQIVNRLVSTDMGDRVFLKVAYNSDGKILVSHDYKEFHNTCRANAAKQLGVQIIDAVTCLAVLQAAE